MILKKKSVHFAIILPFCPLFGLILDSKRFSTETQGNYLRYVALLSVCGDALRKAFDNLPDTFEEKLNKFKRHCHRLQGNSKMRELLSRNVLKYVLYLLDNMFNRWGERSRNYTYFVSLSITRTPRKFASP